MFKLPEKTDWMVKQNKHEATLAYAQDMYALAQRFPFDNALEIGCMWGVSTLALLLGGKGKLTSVDKSDYTHAAEETEINGLKDRWQFVCMDSRNYWEYQSEKQERFDLVYIDGDHGYEYARLDIAEGWKLLTKGGILAIDDALHPHNRDKYGVALAVLQHWHDNSIKEVGFVGKILWLKK